MTSTSPAWWAEPRGRHWPARAPVLAPAGMVATSNPLATAAGLAALARGGSAVDAAIAADAVLGVTDPHLTGVGGDCAAIIHPGGAAAPVGLNATGTAPAAATVEEMRRRGHARMPQDGPLSVTVPGAVAGWAALHARFGRLPLGDLLQPAIRYAADGAPIAPVTSLMWRRQVAKIERHPALGAQYLIDGVIPAPGQIRRAPALARTLAAIARDGADVFYRGALGERLVAGARTAGALLAAEDLAGYQPTWVAALATGFEGGTVWELPPNTQGLTVLIGLSILGELGLNEVRWGTAEHGHAVIEAMKAAFAVRDALLGDPAAMTVKPEALLAPGFVRELAAEFDGKRAGPARPPFRPPSGGTVYVAAADASGAMASFISSVYMHFGSGVVAGDTGVLLQNRGARFRLEPGTPQTLAPGRRPLHTIIPGLAERPGELRACLGVTGADVQPQGHVQVLLNLLRFRMTAQEALDAPRFRVEADGRVMVEEGIGAEARRGLEDRGHAVSVDDPLGFGAAQLVVRDLRSGVLAGATESRRDGVVSGR